MCRELLFAIATASGAAPRDGVASPSKLGRYIVEEPIGSGAMGTVFAGFDPDLKRPVALKVLNTEPNEAAQERLIREAQALAQLSHPNVVAVYDVGRSDQEVFIAMERLVGRDLERWLAEGSRSWKQIVDLFVDVARGLVAAHAAGIVHRDLKPRNIFVEDSGRVCVTDFGLARVQSTADDHARVTGDVRSLGTAALVGTPAYMAPEVLDGQPATERSDQFSFCVALHEALTGQRPFTGGTAPELRDAMRAGVTMRASRAVPAWLCRLIERGLAEQPEQRHASIEALMIALRRARARGRRRIVLAGAAALASAFAISGAFAAQRIAGDDAIEPCTGAEQQLASVWTDERADRVRQAFIATKLPYAEDTWRSVERSINAYRERWATGWREACVATSVRKEQSAELLDKRMVCLDRKRAELSSLVDVLGAADKTLVADGPLAVAKLSPPESCADREAMVATPASPADLGQRVAVTAVTQTIAQARAHWAAGQYVRGLEQLRRIEPQAEAIAHLPTLASFLSLKGLLEDETSAFDQAEVTWRRTLQVAAQAGDTWLVGRTWLDLVRLLGVRKHDSKQALTLVPAAQAAVALTRSADLENRLHSYLGSIHREAENFVEAERELEQGLAGYKKRARSEHDFDVATASTNLGLTKHAIGKLEEAEKLHRSALASFEHIYGPHHPRTAAAHNNVGMIMQGMERFEEARKEFQTCIDVLSAALGPDHVSLAGLLSNLALAEGGAGKRHDAVKTHRRAVAILEAKVPPNHPHLLKVRANLALELQGIGELDEAQRLLESTVKAAEAAFGPNDRRTAIHLGELAEVLVDQKACKKARPIFKRVIAIHESFKPVDEYMLAIALDGSAKCASTDAERIAVLERALSIRLGIDEQPESVANTRLWLARALRKKDPTRARKLATEARAVYASLGDRGKAKVAAIDNEFK